MPGCHPFKGVSRDKARTHTHTHVHIHTHIYTYTCTPLTKPNTFLQWLCQYLERHALEHDQRRYC